MSDRIKKIKVKKADGSMTDYIPIGVDAENVDFNNGFNLDNIVGSINPDESGSIATQLSKSIKYYDCVADMKADTTLNGEGAARTLGYYEPGDGGGAIYNIIEDNTLIDDGGSVHDLDNGLKAKLIIDNEINVKQFGVYADGTRDDTAIINKAIKFLSKQGKGILKGVVNKVSKINGTIYFCNNITYDFDRYELTGNGENTLIESGYYDNITDTVKRNYDPNASYDGAHFPSNRILNSKLLGATFSNCYMAIKALCLNNNTKIEGCNFKSSVQNSVDISYSWGISFIKNNVHGTAYFHNFSDWTLILNNSFEGSQGADEILLKIGQGSFSAKIESNGFHHSHKAIELINEINNTEICNNHFESNDYAIYQAGETGVTTNIYIHNNWFYCSKNTDYGIYAESLSNSNIEFNWFREMVATFTKKVYLKGQNAVSTTIRETAGNSNFTAPVEGYDVSNGVIMEMYGGRYDNNAHPQREYWAGNYTSEKYIAKYNNRPNTIPLCSKSYSNNGRVLTVTTFVDYSTNYGVRQPVLFYLENTPSNKNKTIISGLIVGTNITILTNEQLDNEYNPISSTVTVSITNNEGKLAIVFDAGSSSQALGQPTGWVKAL